MAEGPEAVISSLDGASKDSECKEYDAKYAERKFWYISSRIVCQQPVHREVLELMTCP